MRLATASDAARLCALATQVFLHTYATGGITDPLAAFVTRQFDAARFLATIGDPARAIIVDEIDNCLIGYAELAFRMPCGDVPDVTTEVATLYVQEHFVRTGAGTRLLEASAALAREREGTPDLWLSVYAGNPGAVAFYLDRGFSRCGTAWFELGAERHENHVMVRRH